MQGVDAKELFSQLDIDTDQVNENIVVMSGGPVEKARGFILHSNDFKQEDTIEIDSSFSVTGTVDALKAVATGDGPEKMIFALGYAGWSAGQLDDEMQQNAWLIVDPDQDLIFGSAPDDLWAMAVKKLGIDPGMLSMSAGRA